MTGKIQNFCSVVKVVCHLTLQMSPCYEADHACVLLVFVVFCGFFFVVSSCFLTLISVLCLFVLVTVVEES